MPENLKPFRLQRKLEKFIPRTKYQPTRYVDKIESVGKKLAQCIMIDDSEHLYITDDFIVTHNTLMAIAAGLEQTIGTKKRYKSLIVTKPVLPMGGKNSDIGFLPGDLEEKMAPWIAPIKDNLRFLMSSGTGRKTKKSEENFTQLFEQGIIEVEALMYIRGRSIANSFVIIDEAQNLTLHELKTIITRVGEGTKIVLTGDIEQIDAAHLDKTTNGLAIAIEKFKGQSIAGAILLKRGERSALATLASQIL